MTNEKCIDTIGKYESEFKALWQRLGFSVDWDLQYQTISDLSQRISQKSFLELAKSGKCRDYNIPKLRNLSLYTAIAPVLSGDFLPAVQGVVVD